MNFLAIRNAVIDRTKRPDRTTEIDLFINEAVSQYVIRGSFIRDLVESSLAIDNTLYGATISISALTGFRRFEYIKIDGTLIKLLKVTPNSMIECCQLRPNTYYLAGTSLTYVLDRLATSLDIGYYAYPAVLDAVTVNTHWLFDASPYAIIHLVSGKIFQSIGDDASARGSLALAEEAYRVLFNDLHQETL